MLAPTTPTRRKKFVQGFAFDIDGLEAHDPDEEVDRNGAKGSVIVYWKNFTPGWHKALD
jgi:hypothetical protein